MAAPNKNQKSQPAVDAPKAKGGPISAPNASDAKGAAAEASGSAGEGAETTAAPSPGAQAIQEKVAGGVGLPGNAKADNGAEEIPGKYRKFKK